jgi:hypothetical protein
VKYKKLIRTQTIIIDSIKLYKTHTQKKIVSALTKVTDWNSLNPHETVARKITLRPFYHVSPSSAS